jgi:hypothetical protein
MTMNKAAWFLLGTALGSGIGVGITYIYMKDKFEARLNEEVNALKAHYVERDRELAKKNEERKRELEEKIYSDDEINEFVDYTKLYYTNKTTDKESVISYNEAITNTEDISAAAEIISDVDWDDPDFDNYRKVSVDYFEDGAIFESLSGEELDGFELIAGDEWKGAFGEYTPNVVYVRNHDLKTDYEIIEQEGPHPTPKDE